jgi:thymidylate synthase, flavin-dependent
MRIIKPSFVILDELNNDQILKKIESCGRVCYKSEHLTAAGSAEKFVRSIISRGHESVIEHVAFSVRFICDRGVSHEVVRHRLASYSQESTRYCNYCKEEFGREITVIEPVYLEVGSRAYDFWHQACLFAEESYFKLLDAGCEPQEARAVLPNSQKTELIMSANLREWRHFLRLRTAKAAHPQVRELTIALLENLSRLVPAVFSDLL